MSEQQGCRDGNCLLRIGPCVGQHTNGGCNCLRNLPVSLRIAVQKKLESQREEIERLKAENTELRTPSGYWDDYSEWAIMPDELACYFVEGDVVSLRPYHALPDVWVRITEDGPLFFETKDAANGNEVSDETE